MRQPWREPDASRIAEPGTGTQSSFCKPGRHLPSDDRTGIEKRPIDRCSRRFDVATDASGTHPNWRRLMLKMRRSRWLWRLSSWSTLMITGGRDLSVSSRQNRVGSRSGQGLGSLAYPSLGRQELHQSRRRDHVPHGRSHQCRSCECILALESSKTIEGQ